MTLDFDFGYSRHFCSSPLESFAYSWESFGRLARVEKQIASLRSGFDEVSELEAKIYEKLGVDEPTSFNPVTSADEIGRLRAAINETTTLSNALIDELNELEKSPAFETENRFETYLISTLSTRIGIVLLLVFLIQILVSLYRYTSRLAGVHDMHADAVCMLGYLPDLSLEQLSAFFSSRIVDFGAVPKAPAESLQQLLTDVLKTSSSLKEPKPTV